MKLKTIGFIGLGLIGGSIARRIKQVHPDTIIMAYMRTRSTLEEAKADGIVDIILDGVDETLRTCDMIILCTPVSFNESYLKAIRPFIKPGCFVTDVGSTKTAIHETVIALDMEDCFVGGHPMAGSERTGYACSKASLLENAYYVITPTSKTTKDQLDTMIQFAADQAAIPLVLDYKNHDYAVAAISHVPHIVAAELVHLVRRADRNNGMLKQLAAGGFKDITRIASSSPVMWEQICENNSSNIKTLLTSMIHDLQEVIDQLDNKNGAYVNEYFKEAGEYRNSVPDHSIGLFDKVHKLYVHIPDQPGTIATVASLLAFNSISLKNIGIIYNREFEEGVLEIVLYDEESCQKGAQVLEERNYIVHIR